MTGQDPPRVYISRKIELATEVVSKQNGMQTSSTPRQTPTSKRLLLNHVFQTVGYNALQGHETDLEDHFLKTKVVSILLKTVFYFFLADVCMCACTCMWFGHACKNVKCTSGYRSGSSLYKIVSVAYCFSRRSPCSVAIRK